MEIPNLSVHNHPMEFAEYGYSARCMQLIQDAHWLVSGLSGATEQHALLKRILTHAGLSF